VAREDVGRQVVVLTDDRLDRVEELVLDLLKYGRLHVGQIYREGRIPFSRLRARGLRAGRCGSPRVFLRGRGLYPRARSPFRSGALTLSCLTAQVRRWLELTLGGLVDGWVRGLLFGLIGQ
jgi:hypothetical protein